MIGAFDSGIGGLSVLIEIQRALPEADLLYVADRGRAPYGTRNLGEVREIARRIAQWLVSGGATTLVVACNTASAAALEHLRSRFPEVPIVGMEPAVKPAAAITSTGTIGVFATSATFQGRLFESVVKAHAMNSDVVTAACPEWVELVEQGRLDGPAVEAAVRGPVRSALRAGADVLVLGCTHFSFLAPVIRRVAGDSVAVIDPSSAVAAQTARVYPDFGIGNGSITVAGSGDLDELASRLRTVGVFNVTDPLLRLPT